VKKKFYDGAVVLLVLITVFSFSCTLVGAETLSQTVTQTKSTESSRGSGWFFYRGHRDVLNFTVSKGNTRTDGWNYAPAGFVSFNVKNGSINAIASVRSARIWRFRVDAIEGGDRVIIAGIAQVKIGQEFRNNWWFRMSARSMDDGKEWFMIQLWRPIGADKSGGWSFGGFSPYRPASLKLNATSAFQAQGILVGGTLEITS
jgi:hypothetical protein